MTQTLPLPAHYDPRRVGTLYPADVAAATAAGERAGLAPAARDKEKIALVLIDAQIDFIHPAPIGTLAVPGAVDDTRRTAEFLYRNAARISTVVASLDSHLAFQIFYPTWWVDARDGHPTPFTVIGPDDLARGAWRPVLDPAWSVDYVTKLAATDKKGLCVWPYHTMIGSVGHALDPALFEAVAYFAAARRSQPIFLGKGSIPQTEHYSVLEPEVKYTKHPQGGLNTSLLDALAKHDVVYVAGQAKSHCVLESMRSILAYFSGEPAVIDKIRLLVDCTSSVVHPTIDFDAIAEAELQGFARRGVHLVRSTDPLSLFEAERRLPMSQTDFDSVLNLGLGADSLGVSLDELESEDVTLACFVIDMSSSMEPVAGAVVDAYNKELRALRGARTASQILVSTTTFANVPTLLHGYGKVAETPDLDAMTYRPDGCTALYEAVLGALDRLDVYRRMLVDNGVRARALVVVLSDGEDNASKRTADDVSRLATRLLREEGTTLAYAAFGSGSTKKALAAIAHSIGFPTLITASQSPAEIRRVLGQVSASLVRPAGSQGFP